MDSPNAPPQLYAELYFGSSSKPQHDYYLPQDTSRLTLSQHVSVCANLFSECTILLQDNDCYDSLAKLAAVFFDTQQFLVQEGKKIEKRTQNDLGLDWVWEYKLRSNPVTLCDMHYYLQTIWKSLTSVQRNPQQKTVVANDIISAQGAVNSFNYIAYNLAEVSKHTQNKILRDHCATPSSMGYGKILGKDIVREIKEDHAGEAPKAVRYAMRQSSINRYLRLCYQWLHVNKYGGGADVNRPAASFYAYKSSLSSETDTRTHFHQYEAQKRAIVHNVNPEYPPPPTTGQCQLCGVYVSPKDVFTWRRHLLQDLQPYTCLHTDCAPRNVLEAETFETSDDWIDHMQSQHSYKDGDFTECPFCDEYEEEDYAQLTGTESQEHDNGQQRRQGSIQGLRRHIGLHMIGLSLTVLEMVVDKGGCGELIEYSSPFGIRDEETS